MIRGTSSGADDVIGNGKCVVSGHLREAIWMIASNKDGDDCLRYIQQFSCFISIDLRYCIKIKVIEYLGVRTIEGEVG